ncbi:MAG: MMPL family transporter [Sneathiella sp.]|nr:MMPL family transporter [Sneathiella sp.]
MIETEHKSTMNIRLPISLLFLTGIVIIFLTWVTVEPEVSPDFFFGSNDPKLADSKKIAEKFPAEDFLILEVTGENIESADYQKSIQELTNRLDVLQGFNRILSISSGPKDLKAAKESPFWRPLLVGQDGNSTLIIGFLPRSDPEHLTATTIEIAEKYKGLPGVAEIYISGMPYITYQIKESILSDVTFFGITVLVLFAIVIGLLFQSLIIPIGAAAAGGGAVLLTFILLQVAGQPMGLLTANLAIIVFVLVQSQVIYLTNNLAGAGASSVSKAIRKTLLAAALCALTTLLGFLSLLLVSAEPLRQLGVGGAVGVISALLSVFLIYPAVLDFVNTSEQVAPRKPSKFIGRWRSVLLAALAAAALVSVYGITTLKWDPSLFTYFKKGSEIERGLSHIDKNGGSSPLQLVVGLKTGAELDTAEAYDRMWALHKKLAAHESVGTVLSLPALLAEANEHPLAFLIPWEQLVTLLKLEANQKVADSFLTDDRTQALFLLRMVEGRRDASRIEVIEELKGIVQQEGFRTELVGGVYSLQGHLSSLVLSSVIEGLILLIAIFLVLAALIMRSLPIALMMGGAAALIPVLSVGGGGLFGVPLDIISAPAYSVAFGIAVDAFLHLGLSYKRSGSIQLALNEQGRGILGATGVIFVGFSVFFFSDFPPTTRFGMIMMMGAIVAALSALALLPKLLEGVKKTV